MHVFVEVHPPAGFLKSLQQVLPPPGDAYLHLAEGRDARSALSDHTGFGDAALHVGRTDHHMGFAHRLDQYVAVVDTVLESQHHGIRSDQWTKVMDGVRIVEHLHSEEHQVLFFAFGCVVGGVAGHGEGAVQLALDP